ncbi:hypothetical protein LJ754_01595 [Arthrobacter sp. zg-Y40]|uniref:hypothetical protein n=1 Tax=Arthrobacter sp. zg-Y40 TaxID=2886939 RepID=UPI001D14F82E|nr:hypothetical protein [Arthrobacter sp. zg-Y40]MCC3277856.1 hypothetical protein [Arthrobacter sp. zg-Y40]
MDFPLNSSLNSSLALALAVALWLFWVGPYFFRRPAAESLAAGFSAAAVTTVRPPASPGTGFQGNIMNTSSHTPSGGGFPHGREPGTTARPTSAAPLRIRTGRTVLAAVGFIALLAIPLGAVLAAVTSVSWLLPVAGLAVTAVVVSALRSLALRDRRRRMENAFRAAMGPLPQNRAAVQDSSADGAAVGTAARAVPAEPQKETVLFDRESAASPHTGASTETGVSTEMDTAPGAEAAPAAAAPTAPAPFTAEELRAEALKVAAAAQPVKPGTSPWQPVEVPKPIYVDAPKAERRAPEPIALPEPPRPLTKTPLRPGAVPAPAAQERPEIGKINLDDVLQRRRA